MERRSFMGLIGGGMSSVMAGSEPATAEGGAAGGFYAVQTYLLKNGTQLPRLHEYLSNSLVAMQKVTKAPVLALEALVAAHMPQVNVITAFRSLDEMWSVHAKLLETPEWQALYRRWEEGAEQPYETYSNALLAAAPYSPGLIGAKEARKTPRIFEMRVYHSPTGRQLQALHERFAGPEIKIFHRSGINPVLYSSGLFGNALPNLTYVIPFDSLADREKAWTAFGADPEWVKVRAESIEKHGQISSIMQISLHKATPYSPVQ